MDQNPRFDEYLPESYELVRRACLHVATILGTLLETLTVVGGMVPPLLIPQEKLDGPERHPGTVDLDLGMSLAVLDDELYATIAEQLRGAGFRPDENEKGNAVFQRWRTPPDLPRVTIDFLIPQSAQATKLDRVFKLEPDFGAIVTAGLQLVERDWRVVTLEGYTLNDMRTARNIRVCGPGAFVVLKAMAVRKREKNKDAFDLYYLAQHFGDDLADVATALKPLLDDTDAQAALDFLRSDFATSDSIGPKRAARFRYGRDDDDLQADVCGIVQELIGMVS